MGKSIDVCLVEMPFSSTAAPVFSLSILKGCLNRSGISGAVIYGNMLFADKIGLPDYIRALSIVPQAFMLGEAVFAQAAYEKSELRTRYLRMMQGTHVASKDYVHACEELFQRIESEAVSFIEELGDLILAKQPKIVAFSSMFFQNNACIAMANYIKKKNPAIKTLIGGANSVAETAWGLVKCNKSIDYAFSGEADEIFAEVCERLIKDGDIPSDDIPYGLLRADMALDGKVIPVRQTADMDNIPYPDYDDYFVSLKHYGCEEDVYPVIFMEFSRGCWWNMKKPCKFCGLNPASHKYRIKNTKRVLEEADYLVKRYNIKKITTTDNILSPVHLKELMPALGERDYIFFGEVKSNLTRAEVNNLRRAGFIILQPGIESLQDDLLMLMNKGNRAIKHIELLRNFANAGIEPVWHLLLGFPDEKEEYYEEMARVIPLITHFTAPRQVVHIMYIRSSEYVNNAEKYGLSLEPSDFYEGVYPDKEFIRLSAIMYQQKGSVTTFDSSEIWINSPIRRKFANVVGKWKKTAMTIEDRLTAKDDGEILEVLDMRSMGAVKFVHTLRGVERKVALTADEVISRDKLEELLKGKYSAEKIASAVDTLIHDNLLIEIRGELLFLPLWADRLAIVKDIDRRPIANYRDIEFLYSDISLSEEVPQNRCRRK